jgi:plastocyanin
MKTNFGTLACVLIAAAVAAGCGGQKQSSSGGQSTKGSSPAPAAGGGGTVTVAMKNIQFAPKAVTVKVGQTVRWVNQDSVAHNVTATSGATFRSPNFGGGGTYEHKASGAGTIRYVCTIHPGMTGALTVSR